jgi:hypothetical protein
VGVVSGDPAAGVAVLLPIGLIMLGLHIQSAFRDTFADAAELRALVTTDEFIDEHCRRILAGYERSMAHRKHLELFARARDEVAECTHVLEHLAQGHLEPVRRAWTSLPIALARLMRRLENDDVREVLAVSIGRVWEDDAGRNYLALNIARAAKGIPVHRVFVEGTTKLEEVQNPTTRAAIEALQASDVQVWLTAVDPRAVGLERGFVIFGYDNAQTEDVYMSLVESEPGFWDLEMYVDDDRVKRAREQFADLRDSGTKLSPT